MYFAASHLLVNNYEFLTKRTKYYRKEKLPAKVGSGFDIRLYVWHICNGILETNIDQYFEMWTNVDTFYVFFVMK